MRFRWPVALILLLSWNCVPSALGAEQPLSACSRQEIYMFRGVVGYWPHASAMAARLSNRGYCPHAHCSLEESRLSSELVTEVRQGARKSVNLIGYSYGASNAVRMARDLMECGVVVDRLVLIECYDYPEIPQNVRYCVNIYESRPLDPVNIFRGTPARAMNSSSTLLVDIDISCAPGWQDVRSNNHFTMADDPRVQEFVARQFSDLRMQDACDMAAVVPETSRLPTSSQIQSPSVANATPRNCDTRPAETDRTPCQLVPLPESRQKQNSQSQENLPIAGAARLGKMQKTGGQNTEPAHQNTVWARNLVTFSGLIEAN